MVDDYSYDMKSIEEDAEIARRVARHSFVPAQGIEEGGDDEARPTFQTEQSEEDYQLYGPRCLHSTPESERALKLASYDLKIAKLQRHVNAGNGISIAFSFASGSTCAILKYAQAQDSLESLAYGLGASIICGGAVKLTNYLLSELPLKRLQKQRDKLSKLEK